MQDLKLIGDGVLISPIESHEAAAIAALGNDIDIARMMYTIPHPYTQADALERIQNSRWQGKPGFRAAIRKLDETLMGEIGLGTAGAGSPMSVAYWLGRTFWGQGVATRTLQLFLPFAFELSQADFLEATVYKDNPASGHILEKFGFRPHAEGVDDRHMVRIRPAANIDYRLTRADWEARQR